MAVIDCMLLNAYKLWNMSVDRVPGRQKLRRFDFMLAVANELLQYKTETLVSPVTSPGANQPNRCQASERVPACTGTNVVESNGQRRCIVCSLEARLYKNLSKGMRRISREVTTEINTKVAEAHRRVRGNVSTCETCGINAHCSKFLRSRRRIHTMFQEGTCMEIAHSTTGREIWKVNYGGRYTCTINMKHEMVRLLIREVKQDLHNKS